MPTPAVGIAGGNLNTGTDNSSVFIRDVDPKLYYKEAFKYPLVSALMTMGTDLEKKTVAVEGKNKVMYEMTGQQIKKKPTVNPLFEHDEDELLKFEFSPTGAVATTDVTISVSTSDDDYFVAGMEILLVDSNGNREVARVTAVGAGSLTVTRNIGSTGAISLTTSDKIYTLGVVRAEDSQATDARQSISATIGNYVQFLAEPYGMSDIEKATANYHGNPLQRKKMEALSRIKQKLEMQFWLGVKSKTNSTSNPVYHNGGILYWLETQYTDVSIQDAMGTLTKASWEQFLMDALKFNNQRKWVFCSSAVMSAVSGFAGNQLRPVDNTLSQFGMAITEYLSPNGIVYLVREPLFDEITSLNGYAVCLDMDNLAYRYLEANGVNLDLKSYEQIQENDRSAEKGEWRCVGGIDIAVGKSHAILKNVQN